MALHLRSSVPLMYKNNTPMEHTTVPQMCFTCNLLPLYPAARPHALAGIACSVCTVDLAFHWNVMQRKEINSIIFGQGKIVNYKSICCIDQSEKRCFITLR